MQNIKVALEKTGGFSPLFLDYLKGKPDLAKYYSYYPNTAGFAQAIAARQFATEKREILVNSLKKQYKHLETPANIDLLLQANTYTVTTGHQLNIFTGPLYVIYKIVSTINLARLLKKQFPEHNFVPVYWMASEDHDFEEINHFELFGKNYSWQTTQKGAVGRMQCAEIQEIIDQLPEKPELFVSAYSKAHNLSDAVRSYMHQLFGAEGLICIDGDEVALKTLLAPIVQQELKACQSFEKLQRSSTQLEQLGYKTQVTGREINLFYLQDQLRERIVKTAAGYEVLNSSLRFSESEIFEIAEKHPERFSPNVILRPVYQELILPNIAYLGGPAELVYWLQLKGVFELYQQPFPVVLPRNFAMYLGQAQQKRIEKLGLSIDDIWLDEQNLKHKYLTVQQAQVISFDEEKKQIEAVFEQIQNKSIAIDGSLAQAVQAEKQKTINSLENLEKRVKRAEERNHEVGINQVLALKAKLFPGGSPQERVDNYLNFALNQPNFISDLLQELHPLDFSMNVLLETKP
jgi:bacillithiol synthase